MPMHGFLGWNWICARSGLHAKLLGTRQVWHPQLPSLRLMCFTACEVQAGLKPLMHAWLLGPKQAGDFDL